MNYQIASLTLCVVKVSQNTPRCNLPDVIQGFRLVQMHPLLFYDLAAKTHLDVVWLTFMTHQVNFGGELCLDCYTGSPFTKLFPMLPT